MIVKEWERQRAQAVADAMRDAITNGVTGDDSIAATLVAISAEADPNVRLAAYGMLAGLNYAEPWQPLVFDPGWGVYNYGGGNRLASFYLENGRTVHLRGLIAGAGIGVPIAQLIAGYRPTEYENIGIMADGQFANLVIEPSGWMYINIAVGAPENYASLAGVHFDIR